MNSALYWKRRLFPEGECLAVSLCPETQGHLGYAAGQWSKTHQQVYLWMDQRIQNQSFGVS